MSEYSYTSEKILFWANNVQNNPKVLMDLFTFGIISWENEIAKCE